MQSFLPTLVLRHRRENLKKCTLRGLEGHPDFRFFTYPQSVLPDLRGYIVLALDAPPLGPEDAHARLFIVDGTWRYAKAMLKSIENQQGILWRSLPAHFRTAYPRRQADCPDPDRGLASIEAIYLAYHILGWDVTGLLDNYHWKNQFLEINGL